MLHDVTCVSSFFVLEYSPFYLSILLPEICQLPLSFPHVSMRSTFQTPRGHVDQASTSSGCLTWKTFHPDTIFLMNNKSTSSQKMLEWDWPIDRLTNWPIQWVQSCLWNFSNEFVSLSLCFSICASKLSAKTKPTNWPMCCVFSAASAKIWQEASKNKQQIIA